MNALFIMAAMVEAVLRRLILLFDGFKAKHAHFVEDFQRRRRSTGPAGQHPSGGEMQKGQMSTEKRRSVYNDAEAVTATVSLDDLFGRPEEAVEEEEETDSEYERGVNEEDWRDFYRLLPVVKVWTDWVISTRPRFPPAEMNDIGLR